MAENKVRIDPEAILAGVQQEAEAFFTGNPYLDALAGIAVPMARETMIPILAGGRYLNDMVYGGADASDAMDYARAQLAGMDYQMGPGGQQVVMDAINSPLVQNLKEGYDKGFMGIKGAVDSGVPQAIARQIPEDVMAGAAMIGGGLDVATLPITGAAGAAVKVGKTAGKAETIGDLLNAGRKVDAATGERVSKLQSPADRSEKWRSQQQTADRIRGVRNKRTGQYAGAPKWVDTPQKKSGLVTRYANRIERALDNGLEPGYFYAEGRRSLDEISEPGQGIVNAQTTGVTSSQVGPRDNMNYFAKGAEQRAMGGSASVSTTIYPNKSQSEFLNSVRTDRQTPWLGHKRERYSNLLIPEDSLPADMPEGSMLAPNDRWEGRAAGFDGPPSGELQVSWNDEIRELALERVNAKRIERGERPLTIEEAQELHWAQIRAESEGRSPELRPSDTIGGSLDRLMYQHSWESMPGKTAGHMPEVGDSISPAQYHEEIRPLFIGEDGKDRLVRAMGSDYQRPAFEAPGEFQGQYSPSTQSQSMISQTDSGGLLPQSRARVEGTEAVRGLMIAQDADAGSVSSPFNLPDPRKPTKGKWNEVHYDSGGTVSEGQLKDVKRIVQNEFGAKYAENVVVIPTPTGVKVFHPFPDKGFKPGMVRVNRTMARRFGEGGQVSISQSHYNELDWKGGKATANVLSILDNPDAPLLLKYANGKQLRQLMGDVADKYEELQQAGFKPNQKLINVLKTWRDKGLPGVKEMVKNGTAPAVALAILSSDPSGASADQGS